MIMTYLYHGCNANAMNICNKLNKHRCALDVIGWVDLATISQISRQAPKIHTRCQSFLLLLLNFFAICQENLGEISFFMISGYLGRAIFRSVFNRYEIFLLIPMLLHFDVNFARSKAQLLNNLSTENLLNFVICNIFK